MVRGLVFDRKKGHVVKISWCSFADPVKDGIYSLKLWAVTKCLEVVGVFKYSRCFEVLD